MNVLKKAYVIKFIRQTILSFSNSAQRNQHNQSKSNSTVDFQELINLSKYSDNWWNPQGDMRALHTLNPLRIKFIRDGLINTGFRETSSSKPLQGIKILDVGCGGGVLSEPLARIGADVIGLDASKELISIADEHAALDKSLSSNLTYIHSSIEELSEDKKETFDAVVASEILEHVIDQELFLKSCSAVLRPNGSIFITTLNKNFVSWLGGIVLAEYILQLLPTGTHDWNKFITPDETKRLLDKYDCKTRLIHGLIINPLTTQWSWVSSTKINYALHAVKIKKNNLN